MKVKDQLRLRMEELGVSVKELSERLDVSDQTVRHWLSGRSFPGKGKTAALNLALNFVIDYSEGRSPSSPAGGDSGGATVGSLQQTDIETLMAITRMPPDLKLMFCRMAQAVVHHLESGGPMSPEAMGPLGGSRRHSPFRSKPAR